MTDKELADRAVAHLKQTSLSYPEWRKVVRAKGSVYERASHWGIALKALGEVGAPAPTPPPPAPGTKWQRILFMAQSPLAALQAPAEYRVAFTADPAYDEYATALAADQLRAAGHGVYVWYVPTEVSKAHADEIAARLGATEILGQGESADQFDATVAHGRKAAVGNLSALRDDQFAKIRDGSVAWVQEYYKNCQPGMQLDFKNLPVASVCVAVYEDGQCSRFPLADYHDFQDGWGAYGPGLTPEDYRSLP